MKKYLFLFFFSGALALSVSSCSAPEYRPTDGNYSFIIKKVKGKRQWGIVHKSKKTEYIPCQYDSIFSAYGAPYNIKKLFVGIKNGKMYALDTWKGELLGGRGITSLVSSEDKDRLHNNSYVGGGVFEEAKTDEGIMFFHLSSSGTSWVEFGPAEALFWHPERILCKKNGKWAVLWGEYNEKYPQAITPYIYDAIIAVGYTYFWVKKDNKWSAIDNEGKPIHKSQAILNKYLKLPSLNSKQFGESERTNLYSKVSVEEASYIAVDPFSADYVAW